MRGSSLLADIEAVQVYKKGEHVPKRKLRGAAAGMKLLNDVIEAPGMMVEKKEEVKTRKDISKRLTPQLLAQFKDAKWQARKKAADALQEILENAGMFILPDGIKDIMATLRDGLKDKNKPVLKAHIILLGMMAEAVGDPIKNYR